MNAQSDLFDSITKAGEQYGLRLAGSRALSHLRLEKGYRSWGVEINMEITPMAAGLDRFCRPGLAEKENFIGRDAVLRERRTPPAKSLATLLFKSPNTAGCWGSEPIFLMTTALAMLLPVAMAGAPVCTSLLAGCRHPCA